jgi:hypothetical protein
MSYPDRAVSDRPRTWPAAILGDVQFWVPFTVLMIGLLLLRLVQ